MREFYYGHSDKVSLSAMRSAAETAQKKGQDAVIHHHQYRQPCDGKEHERYDAKTA